MTIVDAATPEELEGEAGAPKVAIYNGLDIGTPEIGELKVGIERMRDMCCPQVRPGEGTSRSRVVNDQVSQVETLELVSVKQSSLGCPTVGM